VFGFEIGVSGSIACFRSRLGNRASGFGFRFGTRVSGFPFSFRVSGFVSGLEFWVGGVEPPPPPGGPPTPPLPGGSHTPRWGGGGGSEFTLKRHKKLFLRSRSTTQACPDPDIRSPPVLDHIPLYSPLYGGVQCEGRGEPLLSLSPLSRLSTPCSPYPLHKRVLPCLHGSGKLEFKRTSANSCLTLITCNHHQTSPLNPHPSPLTPHPSPLILERPTLKPQP